MPLAELSEWTSWVRSPAFLQSLGLQRAREIPAAPVRRDTRTRTLWIQADQRWTCVVCEGQPLLCRGCRPVMSMYPGRSGDCGELIPCPNCVELTGPEEGPFAEADVTPASVGAWERHDGAASPQTWEE